MNVREAEFKAVLEKYKKIAVYGLSPITAKPSHYVPAYMRDHGYDVVGIYPRSGDFAGFKIFPSLADVPGEYRKFVNVFRRSENIPDVVSEAVSVGGVEVLWLQLGISNESAEKLAEAAGIRVVSDRCLLVEHRRVMR